MDSKKIIKGVGIGAGALALTAGAALAYFFATYPHAAAPSSVKVESTPEKIARGAYLANHVTGCMDCHSDRDWSRYSGPPVPGTHGRGGFKFGKEIGIPGTVYSRNITPAGIGAWTDGELIRAFTTGVSKDGSALFPLMPYPAFRDLCDRDVESIVAYVRSLEPVEYAVPKSELDFPVNLIARTVPRPVSAERPCLSAKDGLAYGAHMVKIAGCGDCHSQAEQGAPKPGLELAGGVEFPLPTGGRVRTANLTPDEETGLGSWTKERFIGRFHAHRDPESLPEIGENDPQTVMPWSLYAGMTAEDLGAMYDYLRTVPAVKNRVEKYPTEPALQASR